MIDGCSVLETGIAVASISPLVKYAGKLGRLGRLLFGGNGSKSLKDQAADLVPVNGNRNRVTLRPENEQLDIDLAGMDHARIPTPHTRVSRRNERAPSRYQPVYNTSEEKSTLRPSTQADIRTARRYLERQNR